jgi:hypothetical protein
LRLKDSHHHLVSGDIVQLQQHKDIQNLVFSRHLERNDGLQPSIRYS